MEESILTIKKSQGEVNSQRHALFFPTFGVSEVPIRKEEGLLLVIHRQVHVTHIHIFNKVGIPAYCVITLLVVRTFCTYCMPCFSKGNRAFVFSSFIKYSRGRKAVLYSEMSISVSVMQCSNKL